MKVLLVAEDVTFDGGIERVVAHLGNALVERGHEVCVCSCFKQGIAPTHALDPRITLIYLYAQAHALRQQKAKKSALYKLYHRNIFERILSMKIWHLAHGFDVLLDNYHMYLPHYFMRYCMRVWFYCVRGCKRVDVCADMHKAPISIKIFHEPFSRMRARARRFDCVVVLSARQLDIWRKYYKNVVVIRNFLPSLPTSLSDMDARVVLSIGRMQEGDQKGFFRLIDVWGLIAKKHPTWKLHIIGQGELQGALQQAIITRGLASSIMLRPFTHAIEEEYKHSSIYIMGSYYEALPMVLLEAGAFGLALLAFDINTGPSDIIDVKEHLIADNDITSFANRLDMLMSDYALRNEAGKRARTMIEKHFTKDIALAQWEELFLRLEQQRASN